MFPLPWNKPYRKKNGALTIIDDMFVDPAELQDEIDALDARLDIDESLIDDIADSVTPISQTGTEATVEIASGKYFYLDGALVKAKTAIAIGDTFTEGTNYEAVTAGGLNDLASQINDLASVKNSWVIDSSGNTYTLSTADGVKTVEEILTEAEATLKAMTIEDDTAIILNQIVVPNGDGNSAQISLDVGNPNLYYTSLSNIALQASKVQAVNSTTMAIYSLRLADHNFCGFAVTTTSGAGNLTSYLARKPSNGTTCYIRYSLLHKV